MSHTNHPRNLVPHPLFGDRSLPSGVRVPLELIRATYIYDRPPVFPDSAIPADISRQYFTVRPRPCYVDILKSCRQCGRDFLFFAREQQFWYEELRFWIGTDCVHCPECRRANRHLNQIFQRFSQSINRPDLSDDALATLILDAVSLAHSGILRNPQKLRRLKNLALARIPHNPATHAILNLLASTPDPE